MNDMRIKDFIELTKRGSAKKLLVRVDLIEMVKEEMEGMHSLIQIGGEQHRVEESYEKVKDLIENDIFKKLLEKEGE